jgi:hypothetical protein
MHHVHLCKDFEYCHNYADSRYTMDFTDVKPGAYIYWCKECGPKMHAINDVLQDKLDNEPGFAEKLEAEMNKVKQ